MQATARVTSPHISRDTGRDDLTRREGCRRLRLESPFAVKEAVPDDGVYGWGDRGRMGEEGVVERAREEGVEGGDSRRGEDSPSFMGDLKLMKRKKQHGHMDNFIS